MLLETYQLYNQQNPLETLPTRRPKHMQTQRRYHATPLDIPQEYSQVQINNSTDDRASEHEPYLQWELSS